MILSLVVFFISIVIGRLLIGSSAAGYHNRYERFFIAFALGYGFFAYFFYIIGLLGVFQRDVLTAVLCGAGFVSLGMFWLVMNGKWRALADAVKQLFHSKEEMVLFLWIGGIFLLLIFGAFIPPTAHDALCYHLNIPKRWAQDGAIGYYPYLVNSLFPFLIQIYYGLAILFQVDYAAHFFHLLCAVGTIMGVFALGKRIENSLVGWLAALILISTPGIFNQANLPLNDIALMFFSFAMAYAVYLGIESGFSYRFFVIAGMLGGFALGIKHFAALHMLAVGSAAFFFAIQKKVPLPRVLKCAGLFIFFVFLFGGLWYIRSWVIEGNPIYPYFSNVFQQSGDVGYDFEKQGYGKGLIDFLLLSWRVTMEPQNFGGTWSQIGLVYLVFLPLLFVKSSRSQFSFWGIVASTYFLCWFFVVQNLRFLYFILPILAVLIALKAQVFRWVLYPLLILNTVFSIYHSKEAILYWVTQEKMGSYLNRVDSSYGMIQEVNRLVPVGEKIFVSNFVRLYYLNAEPIRANEFFNRHKVHWDDPFFQEELMRQGIHWIIVSENEAGKYNLNNHLKFKQAQSIGQEFILYHIE